MAQDFLPFNRQKAYLMPPDLHAFPPRTDVNELKGIE